MKFAVLLTLGISAALLQAQVPAYMSYQGRVSDANGTGIGTGTPVNRRVIFRIFDSATGNSRLWSEAQTVTMSNGEFSVLLGQGEDAVYSGATETTDTELPDVFSGTGTDRYLELVVDNGDGILNATDTPISPRQRLTSTSYSFRAKTADSIAPGSTLQLNGSADNGLGWYGTGRLFNGTTINGPVLFGAAGGALGAASGATQTTALRWDAAGNIGIGTSSPSEKLHLSGIMRVDGAAAPPANAVNGGTGTRLVLFPGTASAVPFGMGIDTSTMWSSVPASAVHKWYGGTTERMSLNGGNGNLTVTGSVTSSGLASNGTISSSTAVTSTGGVSTHSQGGVYLEWNKNSAGTSYLLNQKGTGTGGGIVFGEVDSANLITESMILPANGGIKFRGANDVESAYGGNIGNYISFGHPGSSEDYIGYAHNVFHLRDSLGGGDGSHPSLAVGDGVTISGRQLVAAPEVNGGGDGMRLTLWPGSAGDTPFGFGINAGTMFSVVPSTAAHRWYGGTTEHMSLGGGSGNLTVSGSISSAGKAVPVAEESLRIVRGNVNNGGVVQAGTGFTVTKESDGNYLVAITSVFSGIPSVTITPLNSGDRESAQVDTLSASGFRARIRNASNGDSTNHGFSFIAVGPR